MIAKSIKKHAGNLLKHPISWIVLFAIVVLIFLILSAFYFSVQKGLAENASAIGSNIGALPGQAVGSAVGSYEGWEDGKKEAVAHPEVTVNLQTRLHEVGKLEVLKVSAKEDNFKSEKNLANCQIVVVDVVYAIDLQQAVFEETEDQLIVTLPKPIAETNFSEAKSKTLFEKSTSFWSNGSAQYGWEAGINARKKLREETEKKFKEDQALLEQAMDNGQDEVKTFISGIRLDKTKEIVVQYEGDET